MPEIKSGEVEQIISEVDQTPTYRFKVHDNPVQLHHGRSQVVTEGVEYAANVSGTLEDLEGQAVWAYAPEGDARITLDDGTFSVRDLLRDTFGGSDVNVLDSSGTEVDPATSSRQGNWPNLSSYDYTTGGTAEEQLTALSVPNGTALLVQAKSGNAGDLFVGPQGAQHVRLGPGEHVTLNVTDASSVYIQTPNAGDGVNVLTEAN